MIPFPLGPQWPTKDPFLFVAHHLDRYPAGNPDLGPRADLSGRRIGNDFASVDGWNMYHGSLVPGFPQHPHRGFETVTYLRSGFVDHSDSMGATARYGPGDTQWLTAGGGIVHSEMFPLLSSTGDNLLELFQIWVNLPQATKMAEPHFSMLWAEATPEVPVGRLVTPSSGPDGEPPAGPTTGSDSPSIVTVVAGSCAGRVGQAPPPASWASQPESGLAIVHLELQSGDSWTLPETEPGVDRALYFYRGDRLEIDSGSGGQTLEAGHGLELTAQPTRLSAVEDKALVMILQGRPIGEPVAQYGPFVLNDRAGLEQAFVDYRRTGFGGWPWDRDDPVHPVDAGRFARHPDGSRDVPSGSVPARS
ncbi:MAG: pirin family protein [Acidimicrobiia bacterium]|nr:pirin family protein [Acidimicrobiia bacterium]